MEHFSLFTDFDINLFKAGKHFRIYEKMGSHIIDESGVYFSVWAPNARAVSVIGGFNYWDKTAHPLQCRLDGSGIWEGFVPNIGKGEIYKYCLLNANGQWVEKTDPYAFMWETPPRTASVVWDLNYTWNDQKWLEKRAANAGKPQPMNVYEMHMGSWKRNGAEGNRSLTYRELADELVPYLKDLAFTHVEFMPVMEHPYAPSWGYQVLGYFAPTSRFGTPQDFMYLVDKLHQNDIGVPLDWFVAFSDDAHGIYDFDGTHLYEHADPRKGYHPDWKSAIFNYGRNEVRSFLISNALFWIGQYHADGLRVDAVASMLYLDYSRKEGEWIPNIYGGNHNLEAISFLREFNETVYQNFPDAVTIAEESTSFTGVSRPTWEGGLGFGQKWMMVWMHDTLTYMKREPIYRKWHQNEITFSLVYAFTENFMLPFSHDEVVYGKGSMLTRMTGDEWQRLANLRAMYGYMFAHPGTKLLFMGAEFGQGGEWNFEGQLDWWVLDSRFHKGVQHLIRDLNLLTKAKPALYELAFSPKGFEWGSYDDAHNSVISFFRKTEKDDQMLLIVCNFSTNVVENYQIGVPFKGIWKEVLNTDSMRYGGSNVVNGGELSAEKVTRHGRDFVLNFRLAPLATMVFEVQKIEYQDAEFDISAIEKPRRRVVRTKKANE